MTIDYHDMQMEELRAESQLPSESTGSIGRSKGASVASSHQQISVTVVTEFVRWNEEAISRCTLFSSLVIFNSAIKYTLSVTESSCIIAPIYHWIYCKMLEYSFPVLIKVIEQ